MPRIRRSRDDGEFCNGIDSCDGAVCVHASDPCPGPDGDADCAESCDTSSGTCTLADDDGSECEDAVVCTVGSCQSGVCVVGADWCTDDCEICEEAMDLEDDDGEE